MTQSCVFEYADEHEQVVFCQDRKSGLRAIIGIHSTALGPALGGVRMYPYENEDHALTDVLSLSRGMSYKSALAGLDLGGGKAVIIGDPAADKSHALLRAFGRFVDSLGGRYITAPDVGTCVPDMDVIDEACSYVVGRSSERGGSGDPSPLTALGVFNGMRASAQHVWGESSLRGRRVGVEGVGKVGRCLVDLLVGDGAEVVVTDVNEKALRQVASSPQVRSVASTDELLSADLDVYAPCAMGGALNPRSVELLSAKMVCGAANNQLAEPEVVELMEKRGILYAPDYLVNAGGIIHVADEHHGFDADRVRAKVSAIYGTLLEVYALATDKGLTPVAAADWLAEQRIARVAPEMPDWRQLPG